MRVLHHLRHPRGLAAEEGRGLPRRGELDLVALGDERVARRGHVHRGLEAAVEARDLRLRQAGRPHGRDPAVELETRQALFRDGGHARQRRHARRGGHAQRPQRARLDVRRGGSGRHHGELHLAAEHVVHQRPHALVRDVLDVQPGPVHEHGRAQVQDGAVAGGAVVQHAGSRLRIGDQLAHVGGRHGRMGDEHEGGRAQDGDGRDVGQRVERDVPVHAGVHHVVVGDHADDRAVLRRAHDLRGAGDAARSGQVLDHHRLAERFREAGADGADGAVGPGAGRERQDDAQRPVRVALRARGPQAGPGSSQGSGAPGGRRAAGHCASGAGRYRGRGVGAAAAGGRGLGVRVRHAHVSVVVVGPRGLAPRSSRPRGNPAGQATARASCSASMAPGA